MSSCWRGVTSGTKLLRQSVLWTWIQTCTCRACITQGLLGNLSESKMLDFITARQLKMSDTRPLVVTFWNQCDYFPVYFISSCCFHVKLIVRACAGGSQYKSHSCQPLYFFSVVKSNHQRLALANVDGWMDGFFLAYCSRNQSQTNDIKLQMASLLVSIYGQRQTHINAIHNCTDVNAKQMCRNLEGSRQLALRKHSETYDWERLLFLHYWKQWYKV